MPLLILAVLIAIPLIEVGIFIEVGDAIGLWPTIGLIILTTVVGIWIVRVQGFFTLMQARAQLAQGEVPTREIFDGICLAFAGMLLLRTDVPHDGERSPYLLVRATNVVYATGGPAGLYAVRVFPNGQWGASGAAYRGGVRGKGVTEWQFGLASIKPRWNVSVGSLWFDVENAQLVRAVYRLATPIDIWKVAEEDGDDDVPGVVKAVLNPMRATVKAVTVAIRRPTPRTSSSSANTNSR